MHGWREGQVHSSAMPLLCGHLLHVEMIKLKPETEPTVKGYGFVT